MFKQIWGLKKMVSETYEHIVAILIIGLIFVGAVIMMPTVAFSNLQTVDQQQLRNTALNVFNAMLLDTGVGLNGTQYTTNWGSISQWNSSNVKRFGLASTNDNFYKLDPDKVSRLESSILGNISQGEVKQLLGLQGYDFSLRIIPPFNVTNLDGSTLDKKSPISINNINFRYAVKVSYLDGRPVPNAEIRATVVYSAHGLFNITGPLISSTNALGIGEYSTELSFVPSFATVILRIDVADVATLMVTSGKSSILETINVGFVGDNISIRIDKDLDIKNPPETKINEIYVVGSHEDIWKLYEGMGGSEDHFTPSTAGNFEYWNNTFSGLKMHDPVLLVISLNTVPKGESDENGRQDIIIAGPYQRLLGYSVFEFGDHPESNVAVIRIQRNVVISGMTYTAELLLWKDQS